MRCFCRVIRMSRSYALSHVSHFVCVCVLCVRVGPRGAFLCSACVCTPTACRLPACSCVRIYDSRPKCHFVCGCSVLRTVADDWSHCCTLSPFPRKLFLRHKCATHTCQRHLIEDHQRSAEVQRERSRLKLLIPLAPSQGHRLLRIYLSEKIQHLRHSQVICRIPGFFSYNIRHHILLLLHSCF